MSYLRTYLNGQSLKETVQEIEKLAFPRDFDTIAVRGNSGLLMGAVLAATWDKNLIIVRKDERSHSGDKVEGWGYKQRILIVDDFIESGDTVDIIYESIIETCDTPTIIGIVLYADNKNLCGYMHPDGTRFDVWSVQRRIYGRKRKM